MRRPIRTAAAAARDLEALQLAMQKARSAIFEANDKYGSDDEAKEQAGLNALPWLTSDKGDRLLALTTQLLDTYEATRTVNGAAYDNIIELVNHREPALRVFMMIYANYCEFPVSFPPKIRDQVLQ